MPASLASVVDERSQLATDLLDCLPAIRDRVTFELLPVSLRDKIQDEAEISHGHISKRSRHLEEIRIPVYLRWGRVVDQIVASRPTRTFLESKGLAYPTEADSVAASIVLAATKEYSLTPRVLEWLWQRLTSPKTTDTHGRVVVYLQVSRSRVHPSASVLGDLEKRYNIEIVTVAETSGRWPPWIRIAVAVCFLLVGFGIVAFGLGQLPWRQTTGGSLKIVDSAPSAVVPRQRVDAQPAPAKQSEPPAPVAAGSLDRSRGASIGPATPPLVTHKPLAVPSAPVSKVLGMLPGTGVPLAASTTSPHPASSRLQPPAPEVPARTNTLFFVLDLVRRRDELLVGVTYTPSDASAACDTLVCDQTLLGSAGHSVSVYVPPDSNLEIKLNGVIMSLTALRTGSSSLTWPLNPGHQNEVQIAVLPGIPRVSFKTFTF